MRALRLTLAPAALAAMLLALPGTSQAQVEGAWVVMSWETADGETLDQPQPGLFVFTKNHYSIMYVNTAEARAGYTGESMTDEEVRAAQRFAFAKLNLVVEPGGAAALAAALAGKVPVDADTVIMVTGGNTDAASFAATIGGD